MEADTADTNHSLADRAAPVVFVSYSWTSPEHEDWVLDLATELRSAHGLDVRLDKWHLRTGEDALHFMERSITEADKVLIVSDCEYARKANTREGGAGVEAQILTPELYAQGGGDAAGGALPKYAVVVTEYRDDFETGRRVACRPAFYGGRIYIDMTDPTRRPERVEEITRWAYDRPVHVPPPVGGRPDFLDEGPTTGTSGVRARALAALAAVRPDAVRAVEDYFDRLADGLAAFAPEPSGDYEQRQSALLASAQALGAAYAEAGGVLVELARAQLGERGHGALRRLFTALLQYVNPLTVAADPRLSPWQRDPFRYVVPDLFRAAVAALVRAGDFDGVAALTAVRYVLPDPGRGRHEAVPFGAIQYGVSDDALRGRLPGLRADRADPFVQDELVQADLLLLLASLTDDGQNAASWWPDLLTDEYGRVRYRDTLPTFAQAESQGHLALLARALGRNPNELLALIDRLDSTEAKNLRGSGAPTLAYGRLTGRERLGTRS